jgi:hypothetical protein
LAYTHAHTVGDADAQVDGDGDPADNAYADAVVWATDCPGPKQERRIVALLFCFPFLAKDEGIK